MAEWILQHADALRGGSFLAALLAFTALEAMRPRRVRRLGRGPRWAAHGVLMVLGAVGARWIVPAGAMGVALRAEASETGLLQAVELPGWMLWGVALVALDLAIYVQHRAFHRFPVLWGLHALHHADRDLDASSGVRFHPGEIVVSLLWKALVVLALGVPAAAIVTYEALLACASVATHANLRLPAAVERSLRAALVTPDLHRVHHSVLRTESASNFGTITPLWDRLFGTYRAEPRGGQEGMDVGLLPEDRARSIFDGLVRSRWRDGSSTPPSGS